jgi:hypothetical protein
MENSKPVLNMKVRGRHSHERSRSKWEQQVMTEVTQREGMPWKESVEEELWEDRRQM